MKKICLLIVFNHKYNRNIPHLRKIYQSRFSHIYFIVTFNSHCKELDKTDDIINVWESSYCFQGYFPITYEKLKEDKYDYFIIIGDDLILNPKLNEENIFDCMQLSQNDCYIKKISPFGNSYIYESNKLYSILAPWNINTGVNWQEELPPYEEAIELCKRHRVEITEELKRPLFLRKGYKSIKSIPLSSLTISINHGRKLPYPLFKAYSDMLIINSESMECFCHYCGVLSAMNIFVETAIPLAMCLACKSIKFEEDIPFYGIEKWREGISELEKHFHNNIYELLDDFGDNVLYYHPIKLSKWKMET